MGYCQNCGKELSGSEKFCLFCGKSVMDGDFEYGDGTKDSNTANSFAFGVKENGSDKENPVFSRKIKRRIFVVIGAAICALVLLGIIVTNGISSHNYKKQLSKAYETIKSGAELAKSYATLESKVWWNCIHENTSSETDIYTKNEYGRFYSDFNDALASFYSGESLTRGAVSVNVEKVDRVMPKLKKHPKKFEEEYETLRELYVAYSDLTDLVLGDTSHSLNSFTEALNEAISNYKTALSAAKLLFE